MANIPSISMDEAFHLFINGLQPHLQQLVGTLFPKNDLETSIDMAQSSAAYGGAQMARQEIGGGRGQQQNRSRRGAGLPNPAAVFTVVRRRFHVYDYS